MRTTECTSDCQVGCGLRGCVCLHGARFTAHQAVGHCPCRPMSPSLNSSCCATLAACARRYAPPCSFSTLVNVCGCFICPCGASGWALLRGWFYVCHRGTVPGGKVFPGWGQHLHRLRGWAIRVVNRNDECNLHRTLSSKAVCPRQWGLVVPNGLGGRCLTLPCTCDGAGFCAALLAPEPWFVSCALSWVVAGGFRLPGRQLGRHCVAVPSGQVRWCCEVSQRLHGSA